MIIGISHLALKVENMERSLHFYCDILGFKKAFEIHDDNDQPWIEYIKVGTGQFIELFYGGKTKSAAGTEQIGFDHLCLEVTDIEEIAQQLKAEGIQLDVEPKQAKDNNYQCWVRDPDGNRIEFMQIEKDSPQWEWYK